MNKTQEFINHYGMYLEWDDDCDDFEKDLHELLKAQRELCAKAAGSYGHEIKNTPEP